MYQALYRKWRPRDFDSVIGQDHITGILKNQIMTDRLSHAYIFIGSRGTGKTTCARILAKAANCEHPVNGNPCGCCEACKAISEGCLDITELDAASNNGVDNVRTLREEAIFSPTTVRKRVYIIDEVHMLSQAAFNALLKILEEPPEHLMFILATTELHKVPATILSRCQRHNFRRVETETLAGHLEHVAAEEGFALEHEAAVLLANLAEGGVRDSLSLLEQCAVADRVDLDAVYSTMGLAGNLRIATMLKLILQQNTAEVLKLFTELWVAGKAPATIIGELTGLVRDTMVYRVAENAAAELLSRGYGIKTLGWFAGKMTTEQLVAMLDTLENCASALRSSASPRTTAELCLVSLCDNTMGDDVRSLRARISALEAKMEQGIPVRRELREESFPEPEELPQREEPERAPVFVKEEYPVEEIPFPTDEDAPPPEDGYIAPEPEESSRFRVIAEPVPEEPEQKQPEEPKTESRPAAPFVSGPAPLSPELWAKILAAAKPELPGDVNAWTGDANTINAFLEGNVLVLEILGQFKLNRVKQPAVSRCYEQAAAAVLGKSVSVKVTEPTHRGGPARSLEELKQFGSIVQFE